MREIMGKSGIWFSWQFIHFLPRRIAGPVEFCHYEKDLESEIFVFSLAGKWPMNGQWLSVTLKSSCVPSHVCVFVCQPRSQAKCTYTVVSVSRISFPFDFKYSSWARSSSSSIFQDSFMGFYYYESEDCTTPSFWICIQAAVPPPLLSFRWAIRKSSKGIEDMYFVLLLSRVNR